MDKASRKHLECTLKQKEIINEYLATYEALKSKLEAFDVRIEDFASNERYAEKVKKLVCIKDNMKRPPRMNAKRGFTV